MSIIHLMLPCRKSPRTSFSLHKWSESRSGTANPKLWDTKQGGQASLRGINNSVAMSAVSSGGGLAGGVSHGKHCCPSAFSTCGRRGFVWSEQHLGHTVG